jgi:hypothetical protein
MFRRDRNKERTPQELAQRAMLSTIARLGACGYLIYLMIKLIRETDRKPLTMVIAIVCLAAATVVIILTLVEFVKGIKNGVYKESTYYTEEYLEKVRREQEEYRLAHPEEFLDEATEDGAASPAEDESDDEEYDDEPEELPNEAEGSDGTGE